MEQQLLHSFTLLQLLESCAGHGKLYVLPTQLTLTLMHQLQCRASSVKNSWSVITALISVDTDKLRCVSCPL